MSRRRVKKYGTIPTSHRVLRACSRSPSTVLRTAPGDRGIFPRANKQSTGLFVAPVCGLVPPFQIPLPGYKKEPHQMVWFFFMAEKEGFEPSIPFWGIHDFQSFSPTQTSPIYNILCLSCVSYVNQQCIQYLQYKQLPKVDTRLVTKYIVNNNFLFVK